MVVAMLGEERKNGTRNVDIRRFGASGTLASPVDLKNVPLLY